MKLRHANYNEIPARSTSHVSREGDILDLTALRKHDTQRLLLSEKKNRVVGMPDNLNFFLTMQFYRSLACDPREFLTAIFTLRVLSCCLFVCLLFVLVQQVSLVLIKPKGLVIIYRRRRGRRGWTQDL